MLQKAPRKNNEWKLKEEVLIWSMSRNWADAVKEWDHIDSYHTDDHTCTCGKQHIHEVNVIENRLTKKRLDVGSECIHHFFEYDVNALFLSLRALKKNPRKSLSLKAINLCYELGWFTFAQADYYRRIRLRRNLVGNSRDYKLRLNQHVLEKMSQFTRR